MSKPEFSTPLYKLPAREKRKRIERSEAARAGHARQRQRHLERLARAAAGPPADATPELADAWHRLQLHWLVTIPGYRECVRLKLAVALAIEAERYGVCSECGGDFSPIRFTTGCGHCQDRRRNRGRREAERATPVVRDVQQRQETSEDRLRGLIGY